MRIALGLGLFLIAGFLPQQKSAAPPRVVLGYYPSWGAHPNPKEILYERFTHLAHAFLKSDAEGHIAENKAIPNPELARRAHEKNVRVLLSLGGAGSGKTFRAIAASDAARLRYVTAVSKLVSDASYDGIDIDWEPTENDEDRSGLVTLVTAFRAALPAAMLTMAAPASDWQGRWWDVAALETRVDLLNVMSYDFHGPWSAHAGHNAALYAAPDDEDGAVANAAAALGYWADMRRWPKDRLALGIPCYGRGFAVRAWHQKPGGKAAHESIDSHDVPALIQDGWRRAWDAKVGVPTLLKEGVGELISYEDAESAALKGAWAREKGLRGIFFWNIEQDWTDGDHEVVKAAAAAFLK
ncbi:MAG TPA: glycoside hydrolase family 18 protein [Planctomycetota bacterium]|nr:glycoside hydrolase family 18 protein [Planctomycetota bacterium]